MFGLLSGLLLLPCVQAQEEEPVQEGLVERRLPGGVQPGVFSRDPASLEQQQSRIAREIPQTDVFGTFGSFFAEAFSFVRFTREPGGAASTIEVTPTEVDLEEVRDLTVTFRVANKTNRMIKLTFPTEQRLEIIARDEAGEVLEKWSEDRSFAQAEGFVSINPDERLEFTERISTRDMKPGRTYFIEASLVGHPDYTAIAMVAPTGPASTPEGGAPAAEASPAPADVPPAE